jgi:hypothetical protein
MRGEAKVTFPQTYCISVPCDTAVNAHGFYMSAFSTSCFVLSEMDGKNRATCLHQVLRESISPLLKPLKCFVRPLENILLSRTVVFERHSRFKAG